ncbi:MAG: hypothetical protein Q9159_000460 [Coniocarpon cinnabarinum]
MPPKKKDEKPAKASKAQVDKTFGMKNKKGGAAQKQIKQLEAQSASNKSAEQKRKDAEKAQKQREKDAAEQAKRETAELFKPVQTQKVPFGVDPKTVLCQFYKKGMCDKGRKCKFSHDPDVERKVEKKNLYVDQREDGGENGEDDKKKDDMADWDEAKLRSVVLSKHGNPKTTTDKVCKYFIEAVENGKYGWFWTCPNGGDACKYKHSLPAGFVLKTKEQRAAEKALADKSPLNTLTLEDWLETERHKLSGSHLTPVTEETFAKWKKERMDKRAAEEEAKKAKEASGRALFESGGYEGSDDEEGDEDDDDDDVWNMAKLRAETEAAAAAREDERIRRQYGVDDGGGYGGGEGQVNGES